MVNHPNRSRAHSVAKLMRMAQNRADGGDIRLTFTENKEFRANAFLSHATAALRFATDMKVSGGNQSYSMADLSAALAKKRAEPVAYGTGATPEDALENLIQRMADGLTT